MFSAQHPGELVVTAQIPGQPDITAPSVILCEPAAGERVIDVKVLKLACASEDTALISAWVVPRTANEVSCTAPPPHPRSPTRRSPPTPSRSRAPSCPSASRRWTRPLARTDRSRSRVTLARHSSSPPR